MENNNKKIMIIAGEISGDLYGYPLVSEIYNSAPGVEVFGVGGPKMKSTGMKIFYDSSSWGTIGMIEAVKKLPHLYFVLCDIYKKLAQLKPDLLVLIDYPGFNMRLCRHAKKLGIPTLYYFPPSKWTYNPVDVADASHNITKVAAPFAHTYDIYKKAGANVEFVGNPLLEIVKPSASRETIMKKLNLSEGGRVISLLPGSRAMEVKYMLPILIGTAECMADKMKDITFIMPVSSSTVSAGTGITLEYIRNKISLSKTPIKLVLDQTYDVLSVSDFAVITSGTATLEAACLKVPMIIAYKVSLLTEIFARTITSLPKYFGLPNLILNRVVVPEFIQKDVEPELISNSAIEILNSPQKLADIRTSLDEVAKNLGEPGATKKVASLILQMIGGKA